MGTAQRWTSTAPHRFRRWHRTRYGHPQVKRHKTYYASASHRYGFNIDGTDKAYKGYVGGSNYCMEIWIDEKGRWNGEVVSTFDAYQIIKSYGEENGWKKLRNKQFTQSGKPLVMRLMNKDYLRLEYDGIVQTVVITTIKSSGQILMAPH